MVELKRWTMYSYEALRSVFWFCRTCLRMRQCSRTSVVHNAVLKAWDRAAPAVAPPAGAEVLFVVLEAAVEEAVVVALEDAAEEGEAGGRSRAEDGQNASNGRKGRGREQFGLGKKCPPFRFDCFFLFSHNLLLLIWSHCVFCVLLYWQML